LDNNHNVRPVFGCVFGATGGGPEETGVTGLWGSSKALFLWELASCAGKPGRPVLVLASGQKEAEALSSDIRFFAGEDAGSSAYFPPWDVLPYDVMEPDPSVISERLSVLKKMHDGTARLVVTPVKAFMQRLNDPAALVSGKAGLTLSTGSGYGHERLVLGLSAMGYARADMVYEPGEFSVRGGIIDVYPPGVGGPVRVEFLGDTVESMRGFDPDTQRSHTAVDKVELFPVSEQPEEDGGRQFDLADFFSSPPVIVLDEPSRTLHAASEFDGRVRTAYESTGGDTDALPPEALYMAPDEAVARVLSLGRINMESLPVEAGPSGRPTRTFRTTSIPSLRLTDTAPGPWPEDLPKTPITVFCRNIRILMATHAVCLVCPASGRAERLLELLAEHGVPAVPGAPSPSLPGPRGATPVRVVKGELSAGFMMDEPGILFVTAGEIFGEKPAKPPPPPKARAERFINSLSELSAGDCVVHIEHGIGRYRGMKRLKLVGVETDFLEVSYLGDDILYVPVDELGKLQKYIGAETARLDRLGGAAWEKAKARAKKAVEEMAGELLEIYAARAVAPGHAYSPDDNFYREMEAAFEYEETPDQARAIEEVKSDLETPHPMDRLVCGDVGYGKTEVAVRAAFKAALDGKQAAVMVPTTLLASQHLDTFRARLAAFPVRVEMLSRFTPKSAEKEILAGVRDGSVDIVIGTHRLLSRDVVFGDLGLLVVDEEHRFGVRHKEKLKKMRAQVDVLTMTATPIPRTLNMSLSGIRDLSVIETPPPDRQPIKTVVSRFDKQLIREAILREMERGGRVFFVHNRIDTIFSVGSMLAALVPEARISVAHGRMREDQLERVVSGFVSGSTDVLLSTSIVESGLDIPSANTIIINRADMFGLADLYQLRGRVGRSRVRAYAYLLTPEGDAMTETARKRLTVLSELSGLGAGFRLALHDMEIRGAGNVLGPEQSGQIAAVGFDLYTKLLEEAVMKLKGESVEEEVDPALDLKVSAFIPESYVTDPAHRLGIYKRLSAARSGEELADLADELSDRFGPPPEPALKLIQVMEIKTLARAAKAAAVQLMPAEVKIIFSDKVDISPDRLIAFLGKRRGVARYVPQYTLFIKKPRGGWDALHGVIKNSLKELL